MTLVAAFQHNGVPILLGDFLLTAQQDNGAYIRKKVHRISPNLVVGWADSKLSARVVLRELNDEFRNQHVTRGALENFLTHYPTDELRSLSVYLLGWIVDGEPHCFLWNSLYPEELFYGSPNFIGSGSPAFRKLLDQRLVFARSTGSSNVEEAILFSLTKSCRLISDEMFGGLNRELQFGFGFETLCFDGEQFRFVDNVLYTAFDIFYDVRKGNIQTRFHEAMLKYRSFGDYSAVQVNLPGENRTKFFAITSVFDDMPGLLERIPGINVSSNKTLPVASDYYCLYYRLHASDGLSTNGVMVYRADAPGHYVTVTRPKAGGEFIEFDFGFVRPLYRMIRDAQRTRQ